MNPSLHPAQGATVLILGSGGREHALAWKLAQSPAAPRLFCAPGNPGIADVAEVRSVVADDPSAVVALAGEIGADLVVIGPEVPLAAGVADALRHARVPVFGPSRAAARLEWDKAFAKEFMQRHSIPTSGSRTFGADEIEQGRVYLRSHSLPVVIKASGLAAGKGVVIATSTEEAVATLDEMLSGAAFGDAGTTVVIEEFLNGEEASVFAITDGNEYRLLAPSQDHKRLGDDDTGPNTGGMGAYAPAPIVTQAVMDRVRSEIIEPALRGMRDEGAPFTGCLFVGLMIDEGVPRVVEFNSRFGDPETQVILPLYAGDLLELLWAAATESVASLDDVPVSGTAACVVMASSGYPGANRKGDAIYGLDNASALKDVVVFHAGTARNGDQIVTSGGRVLGITAIAGDDDLHGSIDRAYRALELITFDGAQFRRDIGRNALGTRASRPVQIEK